MRIPRLRIDGALASALVFTLVLQAPYLSERVVPIHDTFYNLANFHVFYGELYFHGALPRWYPYGTFGLPSDFEQAASLSPASYAVGLLGALFGVRDVLLLFKLGALLELLALVLGVHLLGRRLFASRATTLVLCLATAGSAVWSGQQWWDFRFYYLLPLLLYFFVAFLQDRRPRDFWLAGVTGVAWTLGLPPYASPLLAFTVVVVGLVAMGRELPSLASRLLTPSRENLLGALAFTALAGAYAYFVAHALDYTSLHAPGRDALTGKVLPETFRTYGGNADLGVVAKALVRGWPLQLPWGNGADNSVYLGLLPLVGLGLALVRERSRLFLALLVGAGLLVLLSLGGSFTRLVYHLPGFGYYRHVGLVYGIVKALLLIASGFGLERLWRLGPNQLRHPLAWVVLGALLVAGLAGMPSPFGETRWIASASRHVWLRVAAYAALLLASVPLRVPARFALAAGLALDLLLFQLAVFELRVPKLAPRDTGLLAALEVSDLPYRPTRRAEPARPEDALGDRSQLALALTVRQQRVGPGVKEVYWYVYQFAQLDPCKSRYRTDYLPAGVDRLLRLHPGRRDELGPILGCGTPKLRLAPEVRLAATDAEAEALVASGLASAARTPVVRDGAAASSGSEASPAMVPDASPAPAGDDGEGGVDVTGFTLGELRADVRVDAAHGAWLLYADAYHPGWRAEVDSRPATVYEADLAFKAVRVPAGAHTVRFWFDHGANTVLGHALAAFGGVVGLALLAWTAAALLFERAPREGAPPPPP